jgi:hypothetical protein
VSTIGLRSKLIPMVVGLSVLAGAHCARAAATSQKSPETTVPRVLLLPAELDPIFQQKLVQRVRGPYERCHPLNLWVLAD